MPRSSAASPRRDARSRLARSGAHCRYAGTGVGALIYCVAALIGGALGGVAGAAAKSGYPLQLAAPFWASLVLCGSCYTIYVCPFFDTEM